jgi:hypothetical protein
MLSYRDLRVLTPGLIERRKIIPRISRKYRTTLED